jgi:dTDP-4-amino-4,6-dideoxygalactose transaminase
MRDSFLVFGQPKILQPEIDEVIDSMNKCWLGTGPKVHQFEKDFAKYKGVPHAVAVNSCTAALHLSCLALRLKPHDEIITTGMTFCATVNAIIHSGARPVLADIDPGTMNISPHDIEKKITKKTKAILVVHFAGRPCDMDAIETIARKHKLSIIEDCAHAIETEYHGRKAGTMGDLGCFSFYSTKNICTGEGGMVLSQKPEYSDRIKIMALHGLSADAWRRFSDWGFKHYYVLDIGFKYNMMDIQAAMGIHQLARVEDLWKRREQIWTRYIAALNPLGLTTPAPVEPGCRHAYHLFNIRLPNNTFTITRDAFLDEMTKRKIGVGVQYLAIPEHPYYQKTFGWNVNDVPHACLCGRETVSLPISGKLTDQDVADVIDAISDILKGRQK